MFDSAVEAGVAAFLADPAPTDAQVETALAGQGVEPWLVQRLVVFLPLAFGRVLLTDVTLDDTFLDGPDRRPLNTEPVFLAATRRAQRAIRLEVERIGLRSAEVNALNTALNQGSKLEDLTFGPVALAEPLLPAQQGDGGVPEPREHFAALLAGHGFADEGGYRVGRLGFDARVYPYRARAGLIVQVDYRVSHPDLAGGSLVESVAGAGATWREAINQATRKFEQSSLHPIIAGLLDRSAAADQVHWAPYQHPSGAFQICYGPLTLMFSTGSPALTDGVIDAVLHRLRETALSPQVHTLRLFTVHQDGVLTTNEALLDSETWAPGEAVLAESSRAVDSGLIACRLFAVLVPAN